MSRVEFPGDVVKDQVCSVCRQFWLQPGCVPGLTLLTTAALASLSRTVVQVACSLRQGSCGLCSTNHLPVNVGIGRITASSEAETDTGDKVPTNEGGAEGSSRKNSAEPRSGIFSRNSRDV